MKREIKFRAWDDEHNQMILPEEIQKKSTSFSDDGSLVVGDEDTDGDWREYHLLQYTGLKDKNGKEIYEGDVVRWTYTNSGKEMVAEIAWKGVGFKPTRLSDRNTFEMEIIGNIYENLNLITNNK